MPPKDLRDFFKVIPRAPPAPAAVAPVPGPAPVEASPTLLPRNEAPPGPSVDEASRGSTPRVDDLPVEAELVDPSEEPALPADLRQERDSATGKRRRCSVSDDDEAPSTLEDALRAIPVTVTTQASSLIDTPECSTHWNESTQAVPFAFVCDVLADISATSSRLKCTSLLARCFAQILNRAPDGLPDTAYVVLNKLGPAHEGLELGIGDAVLVKTIATICGVTDKVVREEYRKCGDLAEVAQTFKQRQLSLSKPAPLSVDKVFSSFRVMAKMSGSDVQRRRTNVIQGLLRNAVSGAEVNFLVRALQGKMRIGVAESTMLNALGHAFALRHLGSNSGDPSELQRVLTFSADGITRAYHEAPSFNIILPVVVEGGLEVLIGHDPRLSIRPGIPVKPMLAHPTNGVTAILDRFQGKDFTCEYKYDGERCQVHYSASAEQPFQIYSRNSESHTTKYPDVICHLPAAFSDSVTDFILDSEVVAVDAEGNLRPFQALQHRGRKNIKLEDVKVTVCLFAFDLLYLNGRRLLNKPLRERRSLLREHFAVSSHLRYASSLDNDDTEVIQDFLNRSIADGCEGLMVKTLAVDAHYTPFKRSYHWLKLKKDYMDGAGDTLDLVPIGAYHGKGKRTGVYGGFLLACYDPDREEYQSICKIGTGFTDEKLEEFTRSLADAIIPSPPPYYRWHDNHKPDVWLSDAVVWEVKAADLTISPVHSAALGLVDPTRGIALRFPRFLKSREDKGPADATSAAQVAGMYRQQALALETAAASVKVDDPV